MKKLFLFLSFTVIVFNCSNKNDDKPLEPEGLTLDGDGIIFGNVYGMCAGDCRELFLVNKNGVYQDLNLGADNWGYWKDTRFSIESMGSSEYAITKALLEVPEAIFDELETEKPVLQMIGDIDYYLYIQKNGKSKELIFDHIHKSSHPDIKAYFKTFLEAMEKVENTFIIDTIETNPENYWID